MVDLSIIIVNFNTFKLTCSCIESVVGKTSMRSYEVIVVDNNSSECDPKCFTDRFPFIKLLSLKSNTGFAGGNNAGLEISTGKVILLLNSDTLLINDAITEAFKTLCLESFSKVGVVTGCLFYPDGKIQYQCNRYPTISNLLIELFRLQKLLSKRKREELFLGTFFPHNRAIYPDWFWGTFFMFKREVLKIFPNRLLPATYFMYQEDMEWCYLIKKAGYQLYFNPDWKIMHYFSSSSATKEQQQKKMLHLEANYQDFILRYYGNFQGQIILKLQQLNRIIQFN